MNIFSIPLFYISFKRNQELEKSLIKQGFKNINHFQSVNGYNYNPKQLYDNNLITIRSYNDIVTYREQHSGIPSLGAIGCTLSHYSLWKKCVSHDLPYIIIVEDDAKFIRDITSKDMLEITKIINKPKGIFISENIYKNPNTFFMGLQFYIASNEACQQLVTNTFPIDVQTDHYIAHMDNVGKIYIDGFKIVGQNSHKSSIQDKCLKCNLSNNNWFYFKVGTIIVVTISLLLFYNKQYKTKLKQCLNKIK